MTMTLGYPLSHNTVHRAHKGMYVPVASRGLLTPYPAINIPAPGVISTFPTDTAIATVSAAAVPHSRGGTAAKATAAAPPARKPRRDTTISTILTTSTPLARCAQLHHHVTKHPQTRTVVRPGPVVTNPGRWMSMMTTSGARCSTASTAAGPFAASPTISMSGCVRRRSVTSGPQSPRHGSVRDRFAVRRRRLVHARG